MLGFLNFTSHFELHDARLRRKKSPGEDVAEATVLATTATARRPRLVLQHASPLDAS